MLSAPHAHSPSAHREEISRVVRLARIADGLEPPAADFAPVLRRLDTWAAFAVVVLASSAVLCAAAWMLQHWQPS
jgi:hypothetical protein